MADHLAVMYAGRIVESGTAEEVFGQPRHPYTQGLLRCIPGRGVHVERLGSIPGIVPSLIGEMHGCSFRNRCDYATDICARGEIAARSSSPGRTWRCIREDAAAEATP